MYLEDFGMREFPVGLTPNTRFFVRLPAHQAAINVVLVALRMARAEEISIDVPRATAVMPG